MFKERKSSFRKNMAFLVFVAFICTFFPEITHAATKPSSQRFPFPKDSIPLISAIFSFASLNLSTSAYDLALFYSLSGNRPKLPPRVKKGQGSKTGQKNSSSFNSHGNSTSQKKPTSQDDD
jgi:hypothetical protein